MLLNLIFCARSVDFHFQPDNRISSWKGKTGKRKIFVCDAL